MKKKWIKNSSLLERSSLRREALVVAETALTVIETKYAVKEVLSLSDHNLRLGKNNYDLKKIKRVFLCGVGKCALEAALEIEDLLGDKIAGGVVIGLEQNEGEHYFNYFKGTHPLPSEDNIMATKHLIDLLKEVRSDDLVIFIVSGGGSTILCAPSKKGLTLEVEQKVFSNLTYRGATIQEINTVRKHLSLARGGWLAKYAYPAQIATLIFSDLPGDNLGMVSSGPFAFDDTDVYKADFILDKYKITKDLEIDFEQLIETPKDKKYFTRVKNIPVVVNICALEGAAIAARNLGYQAVVCDDKLLGEAKTVGEVVAKILKQVPPKTALIYGGETTVIVEECINKGFNLKKSKTCGEGGRNRELALAALEHLDEGTVLISLASDGQDNGPVAGAIIDNETLNRARVMGLDIKKYLKEHDSGDFFHLVGDEIKTGPTGVNVADIVIALKAGSDDE